MDYTINIREDDNERVILSVQLWGSQDVPAARLGRTWTCDPPLTLRPGDTITIDPHTGEPTVEPGY